MPTEFWPEGEGRDFKLKRILQPLAPFKDRLLTLKGVNNLVRGDGDSHMRGMSCLLTGIELFPGNIMGGGGQPAGWASGPSIDQEIRRFLQSRPETKTRLGSLEIGISVGTARTLGPAGVTSAPISRSPRFRTRTTSLTSSTAR
ncbi:hypothetical protein EMGBD4_06260 [Verrucomicrobiota bacterium]|nr:hypothetical protein EMGBD4_06260 [Verrucomicrobiota bacterium]